MPMSSNDGEKSSIGIPFNQGTKLIHNDSDWKHTKSEWNNLESSENSFACAIETGVRNKIFNEK